MLTQTEWQSALIDVAREALRQADWFEPPVDAVKLAQALELTVAMHHGQHERGRIKRIAGQATILLRPEERPERMQWAAAHEIGENLAWKVCRSLDLDGVDLAPRQREELANQLARELLLPSEWFRRDCLALDFDLPRLKSLYATASHELIAWRFLDLDAPAIVTIFDQGRATARRGNLPAKPPPLTPPERACWAQLRNTRQPAAASDRRLTVRGWCIDSPGWEREILYARFEGEEE